MSYNRLSYDKCTYSREVSQNVSILNYIIHDNRPPKCMFERGLVGGSTVSVIRGDKIDLDSELRGITRNLSMCAVSKPEPMDEKRYMILNDKTKPVDTRKIHLPICKM
jgi:hypothetical protein